jgi:hypothetical protein
MPLQLASFAPQLDTLWAHFAATPARYQDISPLHH